MTELFFSKIAKTGTALIMEKATKLGFSFNNTDWINFGQGAPELGEIKGDLPREKNISVFASAGYSPVAGNLDLREKIADYYNQLFRLGKDSLYTYKNVSICGGGRNSLMRIILGLSKMNFGLLNPDYTAYREQILINPKLTPAVLNLSAENGFSLVAKEIIGFIKLKKIQALLLSNPSNPTGQVLAKTDLAELVNFCSENQVLLILDEFYSRYYYNQPIPDGTTLSSSSFIQDINQSSVLILDGFTKGWRYPGWRLSWILGSEEMIETINSTASFLDGGTANPLQKVATKWLDPIQGKKATLAIQNEFHKKRQYLYQALTKLGFFIPHTPEGAFYLFADISNLPKGYNTDLEFTEKMLEYKIITIPGRFFDISGDRDQPKFTNFVRFSYGCSFPEIQKGVARLGQIFDN